MTSHCIAALLVVGLVGCGNDDDGPADRDDSGAAGTDSGMVATDSGSATPDSGTPEEDAGADDDAGSPDEDAGAPDEDAGAPDEDAGRVDAAASPDGGGTGVGCGARLGDTCRETEFCDFPDDLCGRADGPGVCRPEPGGCDRRYDPVCGCDGITYGNECTAQRAGVDIISRGECATVSSCMVTGCSGQVCAPEPVITTCEFRPWYACFALTTCEAQADGACGWTSTPEFEMCLAEMMGGA